MILDKERGRYRIIDAKWLRLFVRTPKTNDGWELQFEVGRLYTGPGLWFFGGTHKVLTLWLSAEKSVDIARLCGKCAICALLYSHRDTKKRTKVTWS